MEIRKSLQEPRREIAASSDSERSTSPGNPDRSIDHLHSPRFSTKSLHVFDAELAARLAAQLVASGLWFECQQLDRAKWYFAVAPTGYARLIVLYDALLCSRDA